MTKPLKTAAEAATDRFNLIAPLVSDGLDKGRRQEMMREIAQVNGVSVRTLKRYLAAWEGAGFEGLKPKQGWERPDSSLGDGFADIVDAAIELRRESPARSVADIIRILELEGVVAPGTVARSTLQRHLAAKGYASSQMRTVNAIEDSLRRAIQKYGVPDKIYVDNGKQYRSTWLRETCAKLGIRLLTARPYRPEGKGLVERFNRTVGKFLSEAALSGLSSIEEYNDLLRIWLEEYYHQNIHSALAGVSPATAFGIDPRPLRFSSAQQLRDAFLHTDTRKVDKAGCISFNGCQYEVGAAYIGRTIDIRFDPSWSEEIEVLPGHSAPFLAKKLQIGPNCGTARELPQHMRTIPPQSSRMLDALKKKAGQNPRATEIATAFAEFWEEEDDF